MFGRDHAVYGRVDAVGVRAGSATDSTTDSAAAMAVGADADSPSHEYKGDPDVPNEDALCLVDRGSWVGAAVADAHYGAAASHRLIERLHDTWPDVRPRDGGHLAAIVDALRTGDTVPAESETTLLVVVLDRELGTGFGLSFGDSSCAIVGPATDPVAINRRNATYLHPGKPRNFARGRHFEFQAEPGELVLVYTDGIDECHYRSPTTSIRPHHLAAIARDTHYAPLEFVDRAANAALAGVDGHPGGQDNIAIIATRV